MPNVIDFGGAGAKTLTVVQSTITGANYSEALNYTFSYTASSAGTYLFTVSCSMGSDTGVASISPSSNLTALDSKDVNAGGRCNIWSGVANLAAGESASIGVYNSKTGGDGAYRKTASCSVFKC